MPESKGNPTTQTGHGALIGDDGIAFRVWAPHAKQVYVTGTFNDWNESATPLFAEDNGHWSADVPDAQIGDEYRYVIETDNGGSFTRIDPMARRVTNSAGNAIVYDPAAFDWEDDEFTLAPFNELVIYEMHVGTFHVKEECRPGTFDTAIEKLGHLRDLGVNAVEVMPPTSFAGDFSWGYNPAHPYAVETAYGGPDALKRFVKAAHEQGIAVLLDVVYNHFGPGDLALWQFDGWSQNDLGGIYFYNDWRASTPWGHTRPDYGRGHVRQYIRDNAMMWLQEYHVDGLRWDATLYVKNVNGRENDPPGDIPEGWTLMQWINDELHRTNPNFLSVAEHLPNSHYITLDTDHGGAGFNTQWDAAFVHPVRAAIIAPSDESRDLDALSAALHNKYGLDVFSRVVFTESHDEVANGRARIPEEIWPGQVDSWFSRKRSTLGASLTLTAPGIPMLFQGQELLEDRWFQDKDPIEWNRTVEEGSILQMYKDLVALRRNLTGTTRGLTGQNLNIYRVDYDQKLIAFHRWNEQGPNDSVVVVVNLANRSHDEFVIGFPRAGLWKTRFNSDSANYSGDFSNHPAPEVDATEEGADQQPASGKIGIGPYTVVIFSQDA